MVIVYCFYSQQVNRHIVDASHVFLENEVIAERLDAVEALQFRLLGDEEGNASFFQASDIPFQKVITYQIEIFLSATLQVFAAGSPAYIYPAPLRQAVRFLLSLPYCLYLRFAE